ncbi:TonB-dependent receptor domain-containing protein [Vogesella fluminis]|uniref:TonB-dependent receptor domain-containing protein n=1 Tax=Vogesella fluminis TaxID=1069161 RepID=UPI0036328262
MQLKYATLMTEAEWAKYKELANAMEDARSKINYDDPSVYKTWDVYADASGAKIPVRITLPTEDPAFKAAYQALADYAGQHNANPFPNIGQGYYGSWGAGVTHGDGYRSFYTKATENGTDPDPYSSDKTAPYWQTTLVLPVVNGKVDSSKSPFANGELSLDQTASYTEGGQTGTFHKVIQASGTNNKGETLYTNITEAESWSAPDTQSGHAWSPVLSATLRPTLYGTVFLRHAQTTRFPSLFELASTSTNLEGVGMLGVSGASKPERSTNWEIGYAHDLTQFFPDLRMADARLSYFDTEIKDFIERDSHLAVIQYDKKKTSGIEFQSRFDSGRFFGSLGATYRRKQELCDKDYAYQFDMYRNRMPECMTGGFPDTLTATSLQPRYSVNLELGTRLLNEQLELGLRSTYHAKAQNKQMDDLLSKPYFKEIWTQNTMSQLYWHSVVLHDFYSRWRVRKDLDLSLKISNLTDRYYMDPMSKIAAPGPGRTLTVGMRARF